MLVLPYVEVSSDPVVVSSWSQQFDGWMRSVAADRPHTCVADWPAYVRSHPGLLQDGTHPRNDAEAGWATGSWPSGTAADRRVTRKAAVNVCGQHFRVTRRGSGQSRCWQGQVPSRCL